MGDRGGLVGRDRARRHGGDHGGLGLHDAGRGLDRRQVEHHRPAAAARPGARQQDRGGAHVAVSGGAGDLADHLLDVLAADRVEQQRGLVGAARRTAGSHGIALPESRHVRFSLLRTLFVLVYVRRTVKSDDDQKGGEEK